MRATSESNILTACLQYLQLKGILAWRTNNTGVYDPGRKCFRSFRGLKGVSDILGIVPQEVLIDGNKVVQGILLAVETKKEGNDLSAEQEWFLAEVRRRGGIGLCVFSVGDLEGQLARFVT